MPEIFRAFGLRFFFYSNEHLPKHIHVSNADGEAKFSIKPLVLIDNDGLKPKDLRLAEALILENEDLIDSRWEIYFNR